MRWIANRKSDHVEDRRGISGGKIALGGGLALVFFLVKMFFPESAPLLDNLEENIPNQSTSTLHNLTPAEQEMGDFAKTIFAYTEDTWIPLFEAQGLNYDYPTLVLFNSQVQSACGAASAASGPFYCPADYKVYFDLTFMNELQHRFGAQGGDFALAYIIAHEVGHHVQTLMGTASAVRQKQQTVSEKEANQLSICLELQADFYAGIWAHYNQKYLDPGDFEEALSAAEAVGDDAIQKKIHGTVVPDSFTHGTSKERMYWFTKGFETGDLSQGNTFGNRLTN